MSARWRPALLAVGFVVAATACSSPAPIGIDDIELPPGLETYEGAEEPTIDLLLSQVIETLPDGADLDYAIYDPTSLAADLDQWFGGALARAGFEASDGDLVLVSGRYERGDQTFTWATIPFNQADGSVTDLVILMLTTDG